MKIRKLSQLIIGLGLASSLTVSCAWWTQDTETHTKKEATVKLIPINKLWLPAPTDTSWIGDDPTGKIRFFTEKNILLAQYNSDSWFTEQTKNLNVNYAISMPQKKSLFEFQTYDIIYTAKAGYKFDNGQTTYTYSWDANELAKPLNLTQVTSDLEKMLYYGQDKKINGVMYRSLNPKASSSKPFSIEVYDQDKANDDIVEQGGVVYVKRGAPKTQTNYDYYVKPKKGFYFLRGSFGVGGTVNSIIDGIEVQTSWN